MLLWIAALVAVALAAFPYYSPLLWRQVMRSSGSQGPSWSDAAASSLTFKLSGMTCAGCAAAAESAVSRLDGIRRVSVRFEDQSATLEFDASRVSPSQIIQAVADVGFAATVRKP